MFSGHKQQLLSSGEVYLRVKVIPGAGKTEAIGAMADGALKIAVKAPPEKGKANKELASFLAKEFDIDKDCVSIISGAGERLKLVKIRETN
jgi:uncharacterized protein (TIGR00251 family)